MEREMTITHAATTTRRALEGAARAILPSASALLRLALLAGFALLAPAPAEAQTTVWSGTLTVDEYTAGGTTIVLRVDRGDGGRV